MFVHLKQSGELLGDNDTPGALWTPEGVRGSTEKIAAAYKRRHELGMRGLMLVSGAGNIVRGVELAEKGIANGMADLMGRIATIQNTIVLASALEQKKVPVVTFIADNMLLRDPSLRNDQFRPYNFDEVQQAYEDEKVVLVGGGTGEDDRTTDNAVLVYAARHQESNPDAHVVVLKGTKHDGVYDGDPAKNPRAQRYTEITAGYMLDKYETLPAVDKSSLHTINRTKVTMQVYRDNQHDLTTVLRDRGEIGTLILPGGADIEPVLAA